MVRTEFVVQEMRYFTTGFESFDQIDYYSSNTGCALFFSLTNATRLCDERRGTGGQLRRVRERRGRVWGQRSVEVTYPLHLCSCNPASICWNHRPWLLAASPGEAMAVL